VLASQPWTIPRPVPVSSKTGTLKRAFLKLGEVRASTVNARGERLR
jgi:hypothetical protein